VKAYGHNGYFKSLWGIVHFYNTRDVLPACPGDYSEAQALAANCWPVPEVAQNVKHGELGDLGLTGDEENAIVAFLKALSDGMYLNTLRGDSPRLDVEGRVRRPAFFSFCSVTIQLSENLSPMRFGRQSSQLFSHGLLPR